MKKVMLGIIIGILLATAVPAAAEEITKKVTATIRGDFTIEVDGEQVALQNAPLAYNGNSYLPVRELANLLGKDVDFEDGVIKLDTPADVVEITSKEEFDKQMARLERVVDDNGKGLNSTKIVLDQIEASGNPSPEDIEILKAQAAQYESIINQAQQAIANLKAKYPQYAE